MTPEEGLALARFHTHAAEVELSDKLKELLVRKEAGSKPLVYCLCGSTARAIDAFQSENLRLTREGHIVLSIGANSSDASLGITDEDKERLDILHLWKIDMADIVLFLNVGGYLGESSLRELTYARITRKQIRFLETI